MKHIVLFEKMAHVCKRKLSIHASDHLITIKWVGPKHLDGGIIKQIDKICFPV